MSNQWNRQPYARVRAGGADVPYKEIRVINPSRGLNLLVADILANDKEATEGTRNIEYVEGGAVRKRMGYQAVGTGLTNAPRGLSQYKSEAANYPITVDGGTLKKYQAGAWTALSGVTVDPSANISLTPLFQKTFAWDGVNGGVVFDGTSVTRPGTMPKAKFSVIYKGYHVASGVDGQPFRLYFAPSKNPARFTNNIVPASPDDVAVNTSTEVPGATDFTSTDATVRAIDINKNDGERVTGIGFFQDVLVVFKESSIYQLYFNASNGFVVERITTSYGAVCHGAICSVENDCYFLTEKGIYVLGNEPNYYAAIRTNELSSRVKDLLLRINPAQYERVRGYYTDDRYFLAVPLDQATTNNVMIVYDRRFYSWAYWTNIKANDMYVFRDKDNDKKSHFYFTEYGTATMCEFTPNGFNDKDQPIEATFVTRAFEGKALDREKYWYVIRPIFRLTTGNVQISFITENGTTGRTASVSPALTGGLGVDEFGALLLGTSQQDTYTDADLGLSGTSETESSETDSSHAIYDIGVGIDSRTLKAKFTNNGLNETFTLLGWILLYQEKDHQRFDGAFTIR
jgi:hypothetical protein